MTWVPRWRREWLGGAAFGSGGGSSSTPQTTTQSTTSAPWAAQQPYLTYGMEQAKSQYQSDQPSYYLDQTVVPLSGQTEQALTGIENRATTGSPLQAAGNAQQLATIQGDYLNSNPNLQGAIDAATRPVTQNFTNTVLPSISSMFSSAGRYGSGAQTDALGNAVDAYGRNVGDISSNMAFNNYSMERGLQNTAATNAPTYAAADYNDMAQLASAGAAREAQSQALTNADIQKFNFGQNVDQAKLAQYMGLINGNYGGSTTSTSTTPYYQKSGSALQGAAGGALSGAATGTMVAGPGWGTAGGAVIGGGLGAMSSK